MSDGEREWSGAIFDPQSIRYFSLLPDEDEDEAYCVRHDREMQSIDPIVHTQGALYTTNDGFSVYSCPECRKYLKQHGGAEGIDRADVKTYRLALTKAFDKWDEGEAPARWFQYVGEGGPDETADGAFMAFERGGEESER